MRLLLMGMLVVATLTGCAAAGRSGAALTGGTSSPATSVEASIGATVARDEPSLPRADAGGSTASQVVLAYVEALGSSDWQTAHSLHARAEGESEAAPLGSGETPQPYEDFTIHEVRVTQPGKALVRVTYSTEGVSALDSTLIPVTVSDPGEWWVIEQSGGLWKVTSKGPWD